MQFLNRRVGKRVREWGGGLEPAKRVDFAAKRIREVHAGCFLPDETRRMCLLSGNLIGTP